MKKTDKNVASVTPMRLVAERIINHDNNNTKHSCPKKTGPSYTSIRYKKGTQLIRPSLDSPIRATKPTPLHKIRYRIT